MLTPQDATEITDLIREATERAFLALHEAFPDDHFYYYALITTSVCHRPAPSASSAEGLQASLDEYARNGHPCAPEGLRWSEADSPYDLFGDEHFAAVEERFLRQFPDPYAEGEETRKALRNCMVEALQQLDRAGFFSRRGPRESVVINVIAPGDEEEEEIVESAAELNPPEALTQLRKDLEVED